MNRLTLFLDWLDEAAGGIIRIAYLASAVVALGVYFGAGHLPVAIEDPLNGIMPWTLAFAVETHTYISARRVRAAWQENMALQKPERNWGALWVNLCILAGLLAFSFWNQLNYLAETWNPPATPFLHLPAGANYFVRAAIIPFAFMAAAFIAPMAAPIVQQIEVEGQHILRDVFNIARKQRRKMLKEAQKSGIDMTGALVELIPDEHARRIVSHAYKAIGAPMEQRAGEIPQPAPRAMVRASRTLPLTPEVRHELHNKMHDAEDYEPVAPMTPPDPWADYDEFEDTDPGITAVFSEDELAEEMGATTSSPRHSARRAASSGPVKKTKTRGELISEGMKRSHKERKAEGRERRQRTIETDVYAVLDAWYESGSPKGLTDGKLADKVFALGHLTVRPSENNVSRYRAQWQTKRTRQAREADIEPMEPQELRELVTADNW